MTTNAPSNETAWRQDYQILLVEDNPADALLLREMFADLPAVKVEVTHAVRLAEALEHLRTREFHVVFLDLSLPDSQGLATFKRLRQGGRGLPMIVLTGLDDESTAVMALEQGAQDYLVKGQVDGHLLLKAIRHAIHREHLVNKLQEALEQIKILRGLIPICATCKKIRDDQGYWEQLEVYLTHHAGVDFTHGLCPDCYQQMLGELSKHQHKSK